MREFKLRWIKYILFVDDDDDNDDDYGAHIPAKESYKSKQNQLLTR